jgi:PEP-CTERM motif
MDIATSAWGPYTGDLLTASEGTGLINLVSPGGTVTPVNPSNLITEAETVSFVPLNLGVSGNPIEGFYVANYPTDIQFAGASEFAGLQGDAIVTEEIAAPGPSPLIDVHYDSGTGAFSFTQVGDLPDQSEDGIFVTAQRTSLLVPEPASLTLLATGFGAFAGLALRRRRAQDRSGRS